jgi:hypothetical protein
MNLNIDGKVTATYNKNKVTKNDANNFLMHLCYDNWTLTQNGPKELIKKIKES